MRGIDWVETPGCWKCCHTPSPPDCQRAKGRSADGGTRLSWSLTVLVEVMFCGLYPPKNLTQGSVRVAFRELSVVWCWCFPDPVPALWLLSHSLPGSHLRGAVQTQGGHWDPWFCSDMGLVVVKQNTSRCVRYLSKCACTDSEVFFPR